MRLTLTTDDGEVLEIWRVTLDANDDDADVVLPLVKFGKGSLEAEITEALEQAAKADQS